MGEDLARPDDFQRERERREGGGRGRRGGHGGIATRVGKGDMGLLCREGTLLVTMTGGDGENEGLWDDPSGHEAAHPPLDSWTLHRQVLPFLLCSRDRSQAGALKAAGRWDRATVVTLVLQASLELAHRVSP